MANYRSPMDGNGPIFLVESMDRFVILVFCFYLYFKVIVELIGLLKYSKRFFPPIVLLFSFSYVVVVLIIVILGFLDFGNS